jgi:hypothetical protein
MKIIGLEETINKCEHIFIIIEQDDLSIIQIPAFKSDLFPESANKSEKKYEDSVLEDIRLIAEKSKASNFDDLKMEIEKSK